MSMLTLWIVTCKRLSMKHLFDPQVYDLDAPFFRQLEDGATTKIGSSEGTSPVNRAVVNLMFLRNEVKLASRGIKPYRGWSPHNVSKYLGVGRKNSKQLVKIVDDMYQIIKQEL